LLIGWAVVRWADAPAAGLDWESVVAVTRKEKSMRRNVRAATAAPHVATSAHAQAGELAERKTKATVLEYVKIGAVAFIIVFGFIRPFVLEPYKIPSGSMEDTLLVGDRVLVVKFLYGVKLPGADRRLFSFAKPRRGDVFVFSPKHTPRTHFIKRVAAVEGDTVETRGTTLIVNGEPLRNETYTKHLNRTFPDFPPFHGPLVPYFHEAPGVAETTAPFVVRHAVEDVQTRNGVPVAFRLDAGPPFIVRVHENQEELSRRADLPRYFLMEADNGRQSRRGYLYQNRATGRWMLVETARRGDVSVEPYRVPDGHFFGMGDNRENSADSRFWGPVPFSAVKGKAVLVYWSTNGDVQAPPWLYFRRIRWNRIGKIIHRQYGDASR
jgi:signal peptidase I